MAEADFTSEIWKTIPFASDYAASTFGRVKRITDSPRGHKAGSILLQPTSGRYAIIGLNIDGVRRSFHVHKIIAVTFLGPKPTKGHEVAHRDGNNRNNRVENLRWATKIENAADKVAHGTSARGEGNSRARLTEADVIDIRARYIPKVNSRALAEEFGVALITVQQIVSRRSWRHI